MCGVGSCMGLIQMGVVVGEWLFLLHMLWLMSFSV